MSKDHTDGPWKHIDSVAVRSLFNGCSVIAAQGTEDAIVATVAEDVPGWQGNGALLAAAPDMLKALQEIADNAEAGCGCDCSGDDCCAKVIGVFCASCTARAAIAAVTERKQST